MDSKLYRLVYCSRNCIEGSTAESTAELQGILARSRRNNHPLGVTGALLFNSGNFAQALEGPLDAVCQTFERIQRDPRHSEVTVVESGFCESRDFSAWSMAFSGNRQADHLQVATATCEAALADPKASGGQIIALLKDLVVLEDDWILMAA